jgi:hypothetical protein
MPLVNAAYGHRKEEEKLEETKQKEESFCLKRRKKMPRSVSGFQTGEFIRFSDRRCYVLQSPGLVENSVGLYVPLLELNQIQIWHTAPV